MVDGGDPLGDHDGQTRAERRRNIREILWDIQECETCQRSKQYQVLQDWIYETGRVGSHFCSSAVPIVFPRSAYTDSPSDRYSQEKYWEDTPGKIGFVLGRHDAGVYNGQIVADVMHHFLAHTWPSHIKPLARCIEFVITKYRKLQNRQVK